MKRLGLANLGFMVAMALVLESVTTKFKTTGFGK